MILPAVPKVTSLWPLQNRKINSQCRVWVLKSPHHAHPKEVTKKHHGNRTPILRIMTKQVRYCEPPYNSVPVLILVLFGLYRPPKSLLGIQNYYVLGPPPWAKSTRNPTLPGIEPTTTFSTGTGHDIWARMVMATCVMTASYKQPARFD